MANIYNILGYLSPFREGKLSSLVVCGNKHTNDGIASVFPNIFFLHYFIAANEVERIIFEPHIRVDLVSLILLIFFLVLYSTVTIVCGAMLKVELNLPKT